MLVAALAPADAHFRCRSNIVRCQMKRTRLFGAVKPHPPIR